MTMFKAAEPLPCRGCGADPEPRGFHNGTIHVFWMECPNLCVSFGGEGGTHLSREAAIEDWNKANEQ